MRNENILTDKEIKELLDVIDELGINAEPITIYGKLESRMSFGKLKTGLLWMELAGFIENRNGTYLVCDEAEW